ncbi:MAG: LptF/LptG family permease [Treponema sp.]|nr:LptF/LptG family permease [Treponema sp.]
MTLVKYLYKQFFPVLFGAILLSAVVLNLVDVLMNLWRYIQNHVPARDVFYIMALYTPKTIWYAIPLGILFATSYTLSVLYAHNELTAVFASGVSLLRFTVPLLVLAACMSFCLFLLDDKLAVETYAKKQELQNALLNQEQTLDNDSIVILAEGGNIVYKADSYEDAQKRLFNVHLVFRSESKKLQAVIRADMALWDENSSTWKLQNATQYAHQGGKIVTGAVSHDFISRLTEPPETFRNNVVSVEEVTARAAKVYIEHLKRTGLPYNEALSLYYKKFSFPFIVFIVVFLSIGLSGHATKNVMLISLALSIGAAVAFYVTQMVTMLLAKFGYISAFSGAWFPVFLFVVISIVLLRYTRT